MSFFLPGRNQGEHHFDRVSSSFGEWGELRSHFLEFKKQELVRSMMVTETCSGQNFRQVPVMVSRDVGESSGSYAAVCLETDQSERSLAP